MIVIESMKHTSYPQYNYISVGIPGNSRYGKAALVAGALDHRLPLVTPHASGLGGMASFRKSFEGKEYPWGVAGPAEGIESVQGSYLGNWFTTKFKEFKTAEH